MIDLSAYMKAVLAKVECAHVVDRAEAEQTLRKFLEEGERNLMERLADGESSPTSILLQSSGMLPSIMLATKMAAMMSGGKTADVAPMMRLTALVAASATQSLIDMVLTGAIDKGEGACAKCPHHDDCKIVTKRGGEEKKQ